MEINFSILFSSKIPVQHGKISPYSIYLNGINLAV